MKADEIPYDSNVGGDGLYWVMFRSEQVIPLCVIHERDFKSRIPRYRKIVVKKLRRTMEKEWKGMSNSDRFLYQKFREVKLRLPVILLDEEEEAEDETMTEADDNDDDNDEAEKEDERDVQTLRSEVEDSLKISSWISRPRINSLNLS